MKVAVDGDGTATAVVVFAVVVVGGGGGDSAAAAAARPVLVVRGDTSDAGSGNLFLRMFVWAPDC